MSLSFVTLWLSVLLFGPATLTEPKAAPAAITNTPNASSVAIPWSTEKRLSWEDFSGAPSPKDHHHALASTNMEMKAKCENNQLKFKVEAVFNPRDSWSRNKKSAALLAHEQLHFDLTELHARMLRKTLTELGNACNGGASNLNKYANEAFSNWHKEQEKYDHESRHGLDKEKQQEWIASVQARLLELEQYAAI